MALLQINKDTQQLIRIIRVANSAKDHIYAIRQDKIENFIFDNKVASVFADMIKRSVPGYTALNQLIPIVAKKFMQPHSNCYDLGCSLGDVSLRIANTIQHDNINIFAVDNSPAMINRLTKRLAALNVNTSVKPICRDVLDINLENAACVIVNYTLQFINPILRDEFMTKIYSGLNANGALLLSEKIMHEDVDEEALMWQLHAQFKRDHQYSDLEINQKRDALENVLIRDTHSQHMQRLHKAGFSKIFILAKFLNFVSYIAVK